MAAIRRALMANCFAAAQRGRVVRVGAGSGGGGETLGQAGPTREFRYLWAPRFGDETSQKFFFEVHNLSASPERLQKISRWQKNISHFYQTDAHTTRFFFHFV